MARIKVDVNGVSRTIREIKRDLHRGMQNAADELGDDAIDTARRVIQENRAIFNAEVYGGFETATVKDTPSSVRLKVYNTVPHAGALEDGVSPAEYADGGPPVEALLPWVSRKMNWSLDGKDDDDSDFSNAESTEPSKLDRQYTQDDIEESDELIVKDTSARLVDVISTDSDSLDVEHQNGDVVTYDYDQIISYRGDHPLGSKLGNFNKGDRVQFYDGDTLRTGIVTGTNTADGSYRAWQLLEPGSNNEIGYVPEVDYVHWEPLPDVDNSLTNPEMETVSVESIDDAKDALMHYEQRVVLQNKITGETLGGEVLVTPWEEQSNRPVILTDDGTTIAPTEDEDWELEYAEAPKNLSKTELTNRLLNQYDEKVNKDVHEYDAEADAVVNKEVSQDVEDYIKKQYEEMIIETYTDKERLAEVGFSWTDLKEYSGRAHSRRKSNGNHLQFWEHFSNTTKTAPEYDRVIGHEFGHAYSWETDSIPRIFVQDPKEYDFAGLWNKKSKITNQFKSNLPNWEPESSNPIHGPVEMYLYTERNGRLGEFVKYDSNDDIKEENRDQLEPLGFSDWKDEVAAIAKANANNTSVAFEKAQKNLTELTEKQVFSDRSNFEEGDLFAFEGFDGNQEIFELYHIDGDFTVFDSSGAATKGEQLLFRKPGRNNLDGDTVKKYRTPDGELYTVDENNDALELIEPATDFAGKVTLSNYDESDNEFPELTTGENPTRIQEAANMAFWYQVKHIEADKSNFKERSKNIVFQDGYSASKVEEVMSTFTEALVHPSPNQDQIQDVETLMEVYPYFVEAFLEDRTPNSQRVTDLLEENGFL